MYPTVKVCIILQIYIGVGYIICGRKHKTKKKKCSVLDGSVHIVVRSLPGQQPYGCSWARLIPVCFYLFHREHRPIHAQCVGWMVYRKHRMHRKIYTESQQHQQQHCYTILKTIDGCDMVRLSIYIYHLYIYMLLMGQFNTIIGINHMYAWIFMRGHWQISIACELKVGIEYRV